MILVDAMTINSKQDICNFAKKLSTRDKIILTHEIMLSIIDDAKEIEADDFNAEIFASMSKHFKELSNDIYQHWIYEVTINENSEDFPFG